MRTRGITMGLVMAGVLAACADNSTSPDFTLDLAEIQMTPASQWLVVPDSARVGEPFVITVFATNRDCEYPGGLSITEEPQRLRIVGIARKNADDTVGCADYARFTQQATVTPSVEGQLTVSLVGRVGNRTDSLARTVEVLPARKSTKSRAVAALVFKGAFGD